MPHFIEPATESFLIKKVQNEADSDALVALANTHTGIYATVVNRYAKHYPNAIKAADLMDEKPLNMWRFILDYKPERGAKLSSYIGIRTDYLCRELLQKGRSTTMGMATGDFGVSLDADCTEGLKIHELLADNSKRDEVFDSVNLSIGIEDVFELAEKTIRDERFVKILKLRHPSNGTSASWRKIGKKLDVSHETARFIYQSNLEELKKNLHKSK